LTDIAHQIDYCAGYMYDTRWGKVLECKGVERADAIQHVAQEWLSSRVIAKRRAQGLKISMPMFAYWALGNLARFYTNRIQAIPMSRIAARQCGYQTETDIEAKYMRDDTCPADSIHASEIAARVRSAIAALPCPQSYIIEQRMDGKTFREIAVSLGYTTERIRQIEQIAMDKLRVRLAKYWENA